MCSWYLNAGVLFPSLLMESYAELSETPQMLPPPPGSFIDREELIQYVGDFGISQGYVVTIKQSKKDKVVVLGCDRGGVYRNRRKPVDKDSGERTRNRKSGSRLTNCPFELLGKKDDGVWVLTIKNGSHNHEALKDITQHPSARRFTEKEVMLIKEMTEAGLKPRQILKRLRQSNPELLSTPKHVYNVKAKLRQGNLTGFSLCHPSTSEFVLPFCSPLPHHCHHHHLLPLVLLFTILKIYTCKRLSVSLLSLFPLLFFPFVKWGE